MDDPTLEMTDEQEDPGQLLGGGWFERALLKAGVANACYRYVPSLECRSASCAGVSARVVEGHTRRT